MNLLEEYSELIERDSADISFLWKGLQMFAYLLSVLSGYSCAILFYTLWQVAFGGHCPLWAKSDLASTSIHEVNNKYQHEYATNNQSSYINWRQRVIVNYDYESHCEFYFATCILSCMFGVVWLMLFSICGKGGYDDRINFASPWRIVIPALLFNFCLTIIMFYATCDMEKGYSRFSEDLISLSVRISERRVSELHNKECNVLQDYASLYNPREHNVCGIFYALGILSWIMAGSWMTGFLILFTRFIAVADFRLLKVQIFEIASDASVHVPEAQD